MIESLMPCPATVNSLACQMWSLNRLQQNAQFSPVGGTLTRNYSAKTFRKLFSLFKN